MYINKLQAPFKQDEEDYFQYLVGMSDGNKQIRAVAKVVEEDSPYFKKVLVYFSLDDFEELLPVVKRVGFKIPIPVMNYTGFTTSVRMSNSFCKALEIGDKIIDNNWQIHIINSINSKELRGIIYTFNGYFKVSTPDKFKG
jgi:hypothetical protein